MKAYLVEVASLVPFIELLDQPCSLNAECLAGVPPGAAKITAGYDLPARHVIHAVGPRWHGGTRDESRLLADCYRQVLEIARTHNLETVAFPAISCGIYGYPVKEAAGIAVREVSLFLRLEPSIKKEPLPVWRDVVGAALAGSRFDSVVRPGEDKRRGARRKAGRHVETNVNGSVLRRW